jgi:hypothetical protein
VQQNQQKTGNASSAQQNQQKTGNASTQNVQQTQQKPANASEEEDAKLAKQLAEDEKMAYALSRPDANEDARLARQLQAQEQGQEQHHEDRQQHEELLDYEHYMSSAHAHHQQQHMNSVQQSHRAMEEQMRALMSSMLHLDTGGPLAAHGHGQPRIIFRSNFGFGNNNALFEDDNDVEEGVDIDNMDYEQLLALQERLGFVRQPNQGASEQAINQLPTSKFKADQKSSSKPAAEKKNAVPKQSDSESKQQSKTAAKDKDETEKSCCICLSTFQEGDEIRSLPCFHYFHKDEIDTWLKTNDKCPICKYRISGSSR